MGLTEEEKRQNRAKLFHKEQACKLYRRRSFKRKARCLKFYRLQGKQRSKEVQIKSRMIGGVGSARLRRWSTQSSTMKMFFSSALLLVTRKNHRQEKARK